MKSQIRKILLDKLDPQYADERLGALQIDSDGSASTVRDEHAGLSLTAPTSSNLASFIAGQIVASAPADKRRAAGSDSEKARWQGIADLARKRNEVRADESKKEADRRRARLLPSE